MKTTVVATFIICLLCCNQVKSQVLGSWRDHLSYNNGRMLAVNEQYVFCSTGDGVIQYNKADASIETLSRTNGLSGVGITAIGHGGEAGVLVVGYSDGNVDLVNEDGIFNLTDIKRSSILGDKSIGAIEISGSTAYLCTGFGIVVLNLERREVKESYFIGENGSALKVNDVAIYNSRIYATTEHGVYSAPLSDEINLLDYSNWTRYDNIPNQNGSFSDVEVLGQNVIVAYTPEGEDNDNLYRLGGNVWGSILSQVDEVVGMRVEDGRLTITGDNKIRIYNDALALESTVDRYAFDDGSAAMSYAQDALFREDGLWVADRYQGLVHQQQGGGSKMVPEGPGSNQHFSVLADHGTIWTTDGGRNGSWNNEFNAAQFHQFNEESNSWDAFSKNNIPQMSGLIDLVNVAVDPKDKNHYFVGSWGSGILEFSDNQFTKHYTEENSSLQSILAGQYIRIGGMDFDSDNQLWVTNSEVNEVLSVLRTDGNWESFRLPELVGVQGLGQVLVTEDDHKWLVIPRGAGLYVVNEDVTQRRKITVRAVYGENIYTMNNVFSLAEDNDGKLWVGTSDGVAVYSSPRRIFDEENFYASRPGVDQNDGFFYPLLAAETVTAIAVDGGNRKWLGTSTSGVYLVSPDGSELINHFNSENSPLLSNEIMDIDINAESGEVYFVTSKGLISYRGEATEGNRAYQDVYVYPNPVREDYDGDVVITGLVEDSNVKITDVSGNLVYETTSLGGQAIWNGKDMRGRRVSTGVYLVFLATEDGEQKHVTKLLFIH
ncbi:T9SS type A sorting domain-containing protein [Puteibacter caeruleilacunae]|nr:T9SS type A sorting domain-containing protein [Puteibacter caeruleilacunae]